jgi:uncharacterized protein YegP (UPF0339 family)
MLVPCALACFFLPNSAVGGPVPFLTQSQARQDAKASGRPLKFETYNDAKGEYRWRLKSSNGQVIAASGQGYKDKRDRRNAIDRIKKEAGTLKFETYADAGGLLRWRLLARNGQIIATSGQGYKDKRDCENAIDVIKRGAQAAKVEEAKSGEGS